MDNLAIIYDERSELHVSKQQHPENPGRIKSIVNHLNEKKLWDEVEIFKPHEASEEKITAVHTKEHFINVKDSIEAGLSFLDADTYIAKGSWEAALLSAGSALLAVDLVLKKKFKNIFVLMRPPGHHAEKDKAMGFCLFCNAAVGAQHAVDDYGLNRIAIIDWDVHHGNGTQDIFYSRKDVLYISTHQFPLYPGTGTENEKGAGEGRGFTINYPLPAGTGGDVYKNIFTKNIIKELEAFDPQLLFISAGFDAHKDDPLAQMNLTDEDFGSLTNILKSFAEKNSIPIVSILEGGYNLPALSSSVYAHLKILNEE